MYKYRIQSFCHRHPYSVEKKAGLHSCAGPRVPFMMKTSNFYIERRNIASARAHSSNQLCAGIRPTIRLNNSCEGCSLLLRQHLGIKSSAASPPAQGSTIIFVFSAARRAVCARGILIRITRFYCRRAMKMKIRAPNACAPYNKILFMRRWSRAVAEWASGVYVRIIEPLAIIMRSDKIGNLYCNERAVLNCVIIIHSHSGGGGRGTQL